MTFARVGFDRHHDHLQADVGRQDAFYVIFQLRDQVPHEYFVDGHSRPAPASPKGSLHIADMNAAPSAVLNGRFDSLNLVMSRNLLNELAEDVGAPPIEALTVPEAWQTRDPVLSRLQPILLGALEDPSLVSRYFIDHLAMSTALHIAERYGGLRRAMLRPGALAPWQEKRAREIIAANLAKEVSLSEVASECGLSLSHFSKAFKASVGQTPHEWLQACRVARAQEFLKNPVTPYTDIALTCGFADQSHFNRIFKRATGSTPGAWRRARLG